MTPKRVRSDIWNHFESSDNNKAKCNYCGQLISTTAGSLSNLSRHLKRKHVGISVHHERSAMRPGKDDPLAVIEQHPDPGSSCATSTTEVLSSVTSSRSSATATTSSVTSLQISSNSLSRQQQTTLRDFGIRPISLSKARQLDLQLVRMIVKEYHTFTIVEESEFKKFVYMLCPGYNFPTRKTLSNNLLNQMYQANLEKVRSQLKDAPAVCLTTDSWTSINNETFTAITAHYFSPDMELRSSLLQCLIFYERRTAENVAQRLRECVQSFRIENKIVCCVTDNAANEVAAIKLLKWRHIPCFAHTLNLLVKDGLQLDEIKPVINKIKSIVEYFKRSSYGLGRLQATQEQMQLPKLKLKQDVSTRWNSTYEMLKRILEIKDAVVSTIAVLQCDVQVPTAIEWLIASESSAYSTESETSFWENFDNRVKQHCLDDPTAAAIIEMDRYIGEPLLHRKEDPLLWWKQRCNVYPCERIFSKTGQVLTLRRNRLSPSKLNQIVFLNHNL